MDSLSFQEMEDTEQLLFIKEVPAMMMETWVGLCHSELILVPLITTQILVAVIILNSVVLPGLISFIINMKMVHWTEKLSLKECEYEI